MDEPGTTDLYPSNSVIVTGTSDKDRERLSLARMTDDMFCMTHLYSFRDFINQGTDCTSQDRQEELKVGLLLLNCCNIERCFGTCPIELFML